MDVLDRIAPYRKALAALLVPPLLTIVAVAGDGITAFEWSLVALNAVAPAGTVYRVPNAQFPIARPTPHVAGDDAT